MTITADQELQEYILQLNEAEKQSILQLIKIFVQGRQQSVEQISIEQYNKEIDEAEADIETGEVHSHAEAVTMSKNW